MLEQDLRCPNVPSDQDLGRDHVSVDAESIYVQRLVPSPLAERSRAMSASVPNFSRVLSKHSSPSTNHVPSRNLSQRHSTGFLRKKSDIRRWDPSLCTSSPWDGLRRDEELWSPEGDCFVHLYGKGKSRRKPSFKISSKNLEAANCTHLINNRNAPTCYGSSDALASGRYSLNSLPSRTSAGSSEIWLSTAERDIFVGAPDDALRNDAFQWHLTTRNFFAWLMDKPLVGLNLGDALIDLLERMRTFRKQADNTKDLLSYAKRLGYLEFSDCPEYTLAFLRFAEHFRIRDLWIEAFAHCVGMNDYLSFTAGFEATSKVTKALITRAYLEMDLHLGRVSRALRNFLEDELSPATIGLPDGAQAHLERFRSFLNSFYVNKHGYWPPEEGSVFSKMTLQSMHTEFSNLYEYLVDKSTLDFVQGQVASGGICVLQNVNAFDTRHNYESLEFPLPLIPEHTIPGGKTESQRGLRSFILGTRPSKFEKGMTARTALAMATNNVSPEVSACPLVREYVRFERDWSAKPEEKVSITDARKVRWIVIYCILQMLISGTKAPKEVRDAPKVHYHICLLTTGTPPWGAESDPETLLGLPSDKEPLSQPKPLAFESFIDKVDDISLGIQPDCEFEDFMGSSLRPAPLRINTAPIVRCNSTATMRSSIKSLQKHIIPSRRSSINKGSAVQPAARDLDLDISLLNKGNGLSSTAIQRSNTSACLPKDKEMLSRRALRSFKSLEFGNPAVEAWAPILDDVMLSGSSSSETSSAGSAASSRPSSFAFSPISIVTAASSHSSWQSDDADHSDAFSFVSGDDVRSRRSSGRQIYSMDHESVYSTLSSSADVSPLHNRATGNGFFAQQQQQQQPSYGKMKKRASSASVRNFSTPLNVGFYAPVYPDGWISPTSSASAAASAPDFSSKSKQTTSTKPDQVVDVRTDDRHRKYSYRYDDGDNGVLRFDAQIDIHRAMEMLPQHIPAQGGLSSWMS